MSERQTVHVRRAGNFVQLTADAEATAEQIATAIRERVPAGARLDVRLRARFALEGSGVFPAEDGRS